MQTHLWLDGPAGPEGRVAGPARELALEMARGVTGSEGHDDDPGAWSLLEQIMHPVTVAWGTRDVPAIIEQCRILARRLPRARPLPLDGVAHLAPIEAPELTAELIMDAISD